MAHPHWGFVVGPISLLRGFGKRNLPTVKLKTWVVLL